MSLALRPVLRPTHLPSLPKSKTTYICTACRHARLLRRPKRPYTFSQLITLSDGSAFMLRTTSPQPVYRSTRDTRNAPLWNPSSKELMNVEDDEAGRLAGFRARFGTRFDAVRELEDATINTSTTAPAPVPEGTGIENMEKMLGYPKEMKTKTKTNKKVEEAEEDEWAYEFEEDDSNLLGMISSYGKQGQTQKTKTQDAPVVGSKKGK